jgi:plastocyanin
MNTDDMKHTVTASGAGGFDVTIDANGTGTFTAPAKPGTYPFVCSFHGNMKATLVVG